MNYNEYAAMEIMGWHKSDPEGFVWFARDADGREVDVVLGAFVIASDDTWHPDTDRNQLALVVKAINEQEEKRGDDAEPILWVALESSDYLGNAGKMLEEFAGDEWCKFLLQAICEAHKAAKEREE